MMLDHMLCSFGQQWCVSIEEEVPEDCDSFYLDVLGKRPKFVERTDEKIENWRLEEDETYS
jgi:hypothetical protein